MSMKSKILLLILCSFLFACSSTSKNKVTVEGDGSNSGDLSKVVCKKESVTGSHFKKVVCRTVGEIKRDREALDRNSSSSSHSNSREY